MAKQEREQVKNLDQSYSAIVKRQFKKNRPAVWALRFIYVIIFFGLTADFIANEKPIYAKINGESHFPIFKNYMVKAGLAKWPPELARISYWNRQKFDKVIWPLIPYSPTTLDFKNSQFKGPFDDQVVDSRKWRHWLGTDDIGRDMMAGMIHGTRVAMLVGIVSMTVSSILGIILGAMAGYFGDTRLKASRIRIILNILAIPFAAFYGGVFFTEGGVSMAILAVLGIFALANILPMVLKPISKFFSKKIAVPVDILVMRLIEILGSIPTLLLLLAILAILEKPSIVMVMVIIGAVSWRGIARFMRGELLKVRSLEYIEAANALGFNRFRIILRHAIPNALTSVLITIAFGIAGAILTEGFLSFLNIGIPPDTITWGKMLAIGRSAPEAWWLAIFPGLAIFLTVTIFNLLGDGLADAIDPRLKQ